MVEFSVCATTYNNASRLRICLDSIIDALADSDFEIVIVDNYSTDGTYEIIQDYARRYCNIKVFRFKCSRGLGRQLAFKNSSGRYIITIDTDTEYHSKKFRRFLVSYMKTELKDSKAVKFWGSSGWSSLGIHPRRLVEKVDGWRDYNVGEDTDFLARLCKIGSLVFLPINMEVNEPYRDSRRGPTAALRFSSIVREKRYFQALLQQARRALKNMIDEYCTQDLTIYKLVLRHKHLKIGAHKTFLATTFLLFSKVINSALKRPITHSDRDLNNFHYIYYNFLKNIIDPKKFGFKAEIGPSFIYEHFHFVTRLKPDIMNNFRFLCAQNEELGKQYVLQNARI